jgi:hypothetical protein
MLNMMTAINLLGRRRIQQIKGIEMERTIVSNEDYKLKIKKTWIATTEQWHIEFTSQSVLDTRFEMFLTDFEFQKFKDAL